MKGINRKNVLRELIKRSDEYDKEEFTKYAVPLIKAVFKCSRVKAEATVAWFLKKYGCVIIKK